MGIKIHGSMALIHLAEGAGAGAGGPHQQKGGGAVGVAFAPVGTPSFFADGMNLSVFNDALNFRNFAGVADGSS